MRPKARRRRADELAVQGVGPRVIRALDRAGELPLVFLAQPGAAVAADVVEGPDLAGAVAQNDDALEPDLTQEVRAGAVELGVPKEKYAKAMDYLKANAKTFEEMRIAAERLPAEYARLTGASKCLTRRW